ncbi:MAG: hypothetical protein CBB97_13780 [Candidatus Endolissoclinum sp. TMED37]|nr:MAG: hypothetical protein CBB97_13780 [Candidatus Endolissoclinum sp. TMED37]|tara:strand:- start:1079 stop:1759 length:681 start_codon:yes stop_codon:yes gene_type:complete
MNPEISIVIRSRNEAYWIGQCLKAISMQDKKNYEIIIVDNESSDHTLGIAKNYDCKVISIPKKEFNYSKALNLGIRKSKGKLVAILSAHCIPLNERWLSRLSMHFSNPNVSAVYGKQEPLIDSDPIDKRDLWVTFGYDRKFQRKDFFFHNANSMIRKKLWEKNKFNENIDGLEDQEWAKKVLKKNNIIIYEPNAVVFHYHGIHQSNDKERVLRNVKVIEYIQRKTR